MILRRIETLKEIEYCVDMYMKLDSTILPTSREASIRYLAMNCRTHQFLRCIEKDGKIIAWIMCNPVQLHHMNIPVFYQNYYCSDQTGVLAVRCIKLLHDAMLLEAKRLKLQYCLSSGSHNDEKNTFVRILKSQGWYVKGYIAMRLVSHENYPQVGPERYETLRRGAGVGRGTGGPAGVQSDPLEVLIS